MADLLKTVRLTTIYAHERGNAAFDRFPIIQLTSMEKFLRQHRGRPVL